MANQPPTPPRRNSLLIIVPPPAARFYLNIDGTIHLEFHVDHVEGIQAWVQGLANQASRLGKVAGGIEPGYLIAKKQSGAKLSEVEETALTDYLLAQAALTKVPEPVEPAAVTVLKEGLVICVECGRPTLEPALMCRRPDLHEES